MKATRAVFKLYAVCPHCKTQNGLVSAGLYESAHVNYPRINAGASGFTEVITSNVLRQLEIG